MRKRTPLTFFNCSTATSTASRRRQSASKWSRWTRSTRLLTITDPHRAVLRRAVRPRRSRRRTRSKMSLWAWTSLSDRRSSTDRSARRPRRPTSCSSPSSFGIMNGCHTMAPQQHSPLPSVAHFSHNHHHHHHMVQHHAQQSVQQLGMNHLFSGQNHQYVSTNVSNNVFFKDSAIYEGMGGMGLAAAQQQLKARNKMHEMALRQHLITDQLQNLQSNGDLVLSSEERRTLVQEGYPIPQKYPLSKSEEEALKIVRRKIKNKLSAQESRRKRKEYIDALESRLHCFSEENKSLKQQVHLLEASNRDLQQKLHQYESKE